MNGSSLGDLLLEALVYFNLERSPLPRPQDGSVQNSGGESVNLDLFSVDDFCDSLEDVGNCEPNDSALVLESAIEGSCVLAEDVVNGTLGYDYSEPSLALGFQEIDPDEESIVNCGGYRRSEDVDKWAKRRFDSWRKLLKLSLEESIEDLYEHDVMKLVNLLSDFFLMLGGMYRAFGHIIRARIEAQAVEIGKPTLAFNILLDPRFKRAQVSVDTVINQSGAQGIGQKRKICKDLIQVQEKEILNGHMTSRLHPKD